MSERTNVSSLDGRAYRGRAEFELLGEIHGKGAGSGAPVDQVAAHVFEVADGRITSGRTFLSPADAREYLANA